MGIMDIYTDVSKIIATIYRAFLAFGIILSSISVYVGHETALRVGLLTFFFGGFFRLLNIPMNVLKRAPEKGDKKSLRLTWVRFGIWMIFLLIYAIFLNNLIQIFRLFDC